MENLEQKTINSLSIIFNRISKCKYEIINITDEFVTINVIISNIPIERHLTFETELLNDGNLLDLRVKSVIAYMLENYYFN